MFMLLCSETQGSIKPGACEICKILRKSVDFFRQLYLLLLCRHCFNEARYYSSSCDKHSPETYPGASPCFPVIMR